MKLFSERNQYVTQTIHPPESITKALCNRLWNIVEVSPQGNNFDKTTVTMWHQFYKLPISSRQETTDFMGHTDWGRTWEFIERQFMNGPWYYVYDHLEFLLNIGCLQEGDVNRELEAEQAPYRSVNNLIVQITAEEELAAVEIAANQLDKFAPASEHIRSALQLLSERTHPNHRNVVKESISAIEAMAKTLNGSDKGTLDDALKALKKTPLYTPALLDGFRKIYGWSSDSEEGIRHSMKKEPTLGYAEAKFFLIICSAFVNYLKTVGDIDAEEGGPGA